MRCFEMKCAGHFGRHRNGVFTAFILLALLATNLHGDTPTVLVTEPMGIKGFELFYRGLYWWRGPDCGREFGTESYIRVRGVVAGTDINLARACDIIIDPNSNVSHDDLFIYCFNQQQLQRKAFSD